MFASQVNFGRNRAQTPGTYSVAMPGLTPSSQPSPDSPIPPPGARRAAPRADLPTGWGGENQTSSDRLGYSRAVPMRFIQPPKPYPNSPFTRPFPVNPL